MDAPPSNLTLVLLIMANVIPIINRIIAFYENKISKRDIIAGTANESSVKTVDRKLTTGNSVIVNRLARVEKQLGIPEPTQDEKALYIPIEEK